jgi:tetratricopeptide (TPR) repeat protein
MTAADLFRSTARWTTGRNVLLWLALALAPAFSVTAFVTAAHREHQRTLAREWDARGQIALENGQPALAVEAFRNAMRFSPDDRDLRLRLAESLAAAGRPAEARAYLLGLWQDQPGSGRVNLQLARLAALEGEPSEARRYYHGAIEGAWSDRAEERRRAVRFELGDYLVGQDSGEVVEGELIALAGDMPPDTPSRLRVASLLLRAGLHRRAQTLFDEVLKDAPGEIEALAGAGQAAFALGNHAAVVRYLRRVPRARLDPAAADMLQVSTLVLELDPYRRGLSARERAARVLRAVGAAEARLRGCVADVAELAPIHAETAAAVKAQSRNALARDPDRVEALTALAFRAERAAEERCGPPSPVDRALLLLGAPPADGTP